MNEILGNYSVSVIINVSEYKVDLNIFDSLYYNMKRVINKEALPQSLKCCKTVPAALGEKIGDYAAVSAALL